MPDAMPPLVALGIWSQSTFVSPVTQLSKLIAPVAGSRSKLPIAESNCAET